MAMELQPLFSLLNIDIHNFNSEYAIQWTQDHAEVPIFFVMAYLAVIFQGPQMLENFKPIRTKWLFAFWNLFLALFSFVGFFNTVPTLVAALQEHGFKYTVCTHPREWYLHGPVGLWVILFVYSKIPELMDTVFLVLRKRQIIFLHWFHHCTVLLYCWHSYHNTIAPGLWFAAMNYTVHSFMYFYYMVMILGVAKGATKTVAPFITTIQILQMVMGMVVTASAANWHLEGGEEECFITPANYKLGLGMYSIYFVLFVVLFKKLYLSKGTKGKKDKEFCGVNENAGDAAGHFFSKEERRRKSDQSRRQ